ncbi:MAG: ABC transporter ATP-binding protein, partial [Bacilli bacterium]
MADYISKCMIARVHGIRESLMKYTVSVFRELLRVTPLATSITVIYYIINGFAPAFTTYMFASIFTVAETASVNLQSRNLFFQYIVLYLCVRLCLDLLNYLFSVFVNTGVFETGSMYFKNRLYQWTSMLPMIKFENSSILNLKKQAEDAVENDRLPMLFYTTMLFVSETIAVLSLFAVLSNYSYFLCLISFLTVLPFLVTRVIRGKAFYELRVKQSVKLRKQSYMWSLFNNRDSVKETRVYGNHNYLAAKWKNIYQEVQKETWKEEKKDAITLTFCDLLRIIGFGTAVLLTLMMIINGKNLSLGIFGAVIIAFSSLQESIKCLFEYIGDIPKNLSFVKGYYAFLDVEKDGKGETHFNGLRDHISLENISFEYPNSSEEAICNLSLKINKGEKIAIVGTNGSGKSTLAKLIVGVYTPSKGTVSYDHVNLAEINKKELFESISIVQQEFQRFNFTLREDVGLSNLDKLNDTQKIKSILNSVDLKYDFSLDDQLGVEFEGHDFSGGQWQKLSIARAMFKDSNLIIMDEPTAALDPLFEKDVLSSFFELSKNKTAVMISHRVGLCTLVDRVVVMKKGRIVEVGTHDELVNAGGEYHDLYTT